MSMEGKQLVLDVEGNIAVESFDVVPPAANQLLIQVSCSQISAGSEMNSIRQRRHASPAERKSWINTGLG